MYADVVPLVVPPRIAYTAYRSNGNLTGNGRVLVKPIYSLIVPSAAKVLSVSNLPPNGGPADDPPVTLRTAMRVMPVLLCKTPADRLMSPTARKAFETSFSGPEVPSNSKTA